MRILYVADTLEPTAGSAYKVVAITSEWERQGHAVWLATARDPRPRRVDEVRARLGAGSRRRSLPERVRGELSFRALFPAELLAAAARVGADIVYTRTLPAAPGLRPLLWAKPVFVEVNGDVARELPPSWKRTSRIRSRALLLRHCRGAVFVSRELERACPPAARHALVLANACLPAVAQAAVPPLHTDRPTLCMIGYERHGWTGMDKVVALARALPDLDFLVIGATMEGPPNLRAVGKKTQSEADALMRGCTVALGPLALHRKGMLEASPLKSRNGLALGLPIIQAYEDTDLTEADGCVLSIPNTEDNVQLAAERIREFAWRAYRDPDLPARARALAEGRLSLASKEAERLAFIDHCLR